MGRTFQSYPDIPLIQSENECGDGENTWKFAMYVFDLMRHYVSNGAVAYVYWNMVLEQGGRSTWGWHQNSMISIDPAKRTVIKNPEFYMMKHYSRFIKPGALRLGLAGQWAGNAAAFRNPNGTTIFAVSNPFPEKRALCLEHSKKRYNLILEPRSVNTIVIPKSIDG
jgi:glucosylceramidase